jgi:hypothetical protein
MLALTLVTLALAGPATSSDIQQPTATVQTVPAAQPPEAQPPEAQQDPKDQTREAK